MIDTNFFLFSTKLLNDKSEEDDGKAAGSSGANRPKELMRQLLKDETHHGSMSGSSSNNISNEDLKRILKIQTDPSTTNMRKRGALNEGEDGIAAKRNDSRPTSLRDQNKMLASLLENPPKPVIPTVPTVKTIPDITSSTVQARGGPTALGGHAKNIGPAPGTQSLVGPGAVRARKQQTSNEAFFNQQQAMQAAAVAAAQQRTSLNNTATSATATTASLTASLQQQQQQAMNSALGIDGDQELSKLLDSVIDAVDDNSFAPTTPNSDTPQDSYERMAISAIQKSLMVETSVYSGNMAGAAAANMQTAAMSNAQQRQMPQPPAYPGNLTPQQQQQQQMFQLLRSGGNSAGNSQTNMQQIMEAMHNNQVNSKIISIS